MTDIGAGTIFSQVFVRAVEQEMAPLHAEMAKQTKLLRQLLRQAKRGPVPATHQALAEYATWQHDFDPYGALAAIAMASGTLGVYEETRSDESLDALLAHSVDLQQRQLLCSMAILTLTQAQTGLIPSEEVMAAFAARAGVKPTGATAEDAPVADAPPVESPETDA